MFARLINVRNAAIVIAALMIGSLAFGFAASNTVPATNAGDSGTTISGYTVTDVSYVLNSTNSANLDAVKFSIAADGAAADAPSTVKIKLVAAGSTWYGCTLDVTDPVQSSEPWEYTCATTSPQALAADVDELRVVAAQ
jgi:hypothetical protein